MRSRPFSSSSARGRPHRNARTPTPTRGRKPMSIAPAVHPRARMHSTPPGEPSPFDDGELYDIICQTLDYGIDFYVGLARAAKGPVLDVACGTARILLPVLQAGADADGLDLFQPMLDTARRKADALGL